MGDALHSVSFLFPYFFRFSVVHFDAGVLRSADWGVILSTVFALPTFVGYSLWLHPGVFADVVGAQVHGRPVFPFCWVFFDSELVHGWLVAPF